VRCSAEARERLAACARGEERAKLRETRMIMGPAP
jgi:hypothetical protein